MNSISRAQHWDGVYQTKSETEVSWYESQPTVSLELIQSALPTGGRVIDIGGGASRLVDLLLEQRCFEVTVLDVSAVALDKVRVRLGMQAERVQWITGDITAINDLQPCDVWHDRAVFHFLTDPLDQRRYVDLATRTVCPGGFLVVGTFAPDGPLKCSGLEVCRYDCDGLAEVLGSAFRFQSERRIHHRTPGGKIQSFCFAVFQRATPAT